MTLQIRFQPVTAATLQACEPAQLVWTDQHLSAVLLPAENGWFLQIGFGPCDAEGLLFADLEAVEDWVRCRMGWPKPTLNRPGFVGGSNS